jgi:hypothetical protein
VPPQKRALADYQVVVREAPQGCLWIVERDRRSTLSGPAPDPETARRHGAFAAAALSGLDRIRRRRF